MYLLCSPISRVSMKDPLRVVDEIEYWTKNHGVNNIAFMMMPCCGASRISFHNERNDQKGIHCNFHTPNASTLGSWWRSSCPHVSKRIQDHSPGIWDIEWGTQLETGGKVDNHEFRRAIKNLKRQGIPGRNRSVFNGWIARPKIGEVGEELLLWKNRATPMLVEYSPIPHIRCSKKAKKLSPSTSKMNPFTNNSILPVNGMGLQCRLQKVEEGLRRK